MADEISQEVTETEQAAVDTVDTVEAGPGATEGGSEDNSVADQTTTQGPSRAQERIQQLVERAKAAEAEAAELRAAQETAASTRAEKPLPIGKQADASGHPALQGQEPDADGEVYVNGKWQKADDVIERYEVKAQLNELKELVTGDQKARQKAELDAREAAHRAELAGAVVDRIAEIRGTAYAHLKGEHAESVDELVLRLVEKPINAAYAEGKFTPEYGEQIIKQAFESAKRYGAIFASAQLTGNEQYAQQHKVQPGTPGTKAAKTIHEMTQKEIDAQSKVWAEQAEAQSRSGRV